MVVSFALHLMTSVQYDIPGYASMTKNQKKRAKEKARKLLKAGAS